MSQALPTIGELFEDYWQEDEDRDPREPGGYWASECWSCPAQTWFKIRQGDEDVDLPHGVFERGNAAEDFVNKVLREEHGDYLLTEVPIKVEVADGIEVTGRADAVVVDRNLQVKKVYEIKCKGGRLYGNVSNHHEAQLYHYIQALEPELGGAVVYVNATDYRDNATHDIDFNHDRWAEICRYWISVHEQFAEDPDDDQPVFQPKAKWRCWFYAQQEKKLVKCDFYDACKDHPGPGPKHEIPDSVYEKAKRVE